MNGILKVRDKNPEATLRDLFAGWLRDGRLSAIMLPAFSPSGAATLVLVSDPEKMVDAAPLMPAMAVNAASVVHDIAKLPAGADRVGLLLRSCEMRAVVELVKLRQVLLDNLVLIGIDCPGTYKSGGFRDVKRGDEDFDNNHVRNQQKQYDNPDLRTACQLCEYAKPMVFDFAIGFLGLNPDEELWVESANDKGAALLEGVEVAEGDVPDTRVKYIEELAAKRKAKAAARLDEMDKEMMGPDNLVRYFADCINCHNCMDVCPVCYCRECFFDSDTFQRQLDEHVRISRHKGLTRMPSETLLFHLTRMNHMMTSCVACGICEDSCPAGVGLLPLFKKASNNAQAEFNYLSGRSLDEELPLIAFKEDEFTSVGE
jgi:formate dehydrogenase subunit beta